MHIVNMLIMCLPRPMLICWWCACHSHVPMHDSKRREHQPGVEMTCTDDHTWMGEKIYRQWCIIVDRYWSRKSAVAFFHDCWLFCIILSTDTTWYIYKYIISIRALHASNKEDLQAGRNLITRFDHCYHHEFMIDASRGANECFLGYPPPLFNSKNYTGFSK